MENSHSARVHTFLLLTCLESPHRSVLLRTRRGAAKPASPAAPRSARPSQLAFGLGPSWWETAPPPSEAPGHGALSWPLRTHLPRQPGRQNTCSLQASVTGRRAPASARWPPEHLLPPGVCDRTAGTSLRPAECPPPLPLQVALPLKAWPPDPLHQHPAQAQGGQCGPRLAPERLSEAQGWDITIVWAGAGSPLESSASSALRGGWKGLWAASGPAGKAGPDPALRLQFAAV